MILDRVLTIAIGRNLPDGNPMDDATWRMFIWETRQVARFGGTLVAATTGEGVGSDGLNDASAEETAVFIVVNPTDIAATRAKMARVLVRYDSSSACFADDMAHEPVFATPNGYRQSDYAPDAQTFPLYRAETSARAYIVKGAGE